MLTIIGSILVIVCSSYIGILMSRKYDERITQLEQFQSALSNLEFEITFLNLPLSEALKKVGRSEVSAVDTVFLQIASELSLAHGISVQQAFKMVMAKNRCYLALTDGDMAILQDFSAKLGGGDRESQVSNIKAALMKLKVNEDEAREIAGKSGKLYKGLGVLAGLFIVIILA